MNKVHAVVGTGNASPQAVRSCLKDVITGTDAVNLLWSGKPNEAQEAVFDYVLDNEVPFTLYYEDEDTPPRVFRESEFGVVKKVREPLRWCVSSVVNGGHVLYLWNDDDPHAIWPVVDLAPKGILIKDLSNGLIPIEVEEPPAWAANGGTPPVELDLELEKLLDGEESRFTKDELEVMTAAAVKRYGARLGLNATTKSGIIDELYPSAAAPDLPTQTVPVLDYLNALLAMLNNAVVTLKAAIEEQG
jgi:hypothetical protein